MSIVARLALLFIAVPLLELFILIRLGGAIGLAPTLALCVLTGMAGAWLARREGLRALWSYQERLARGGVPGRALMDGLCILMGGAVLLTPGLLTDLLGFALLLPPSRHWIQARMKRRIERRMADGSIRVTPFGGFPGWRDAPRSWRDAPRSWRGPPRGWRGAGMGLWARSWRRPFRRRRRREGARIPSGPRRNHPKRSHPARETASRERNDS